jgi:hypothetical protein
MKKKIRNPLYASNFYLERKLSPSSFLSSPLTVTTTYTATVDGTTSTSDEPLSPDLPPIIPAGPTGPAARCVDTWS